MALRDDFEPVRGQLLHRSSLLTLGQAVCELVREETRLSTLRSQHTPHTHSVLAAPSPQTEHSDKSDRSGRGPSKTHDNPFCRYCRRRGHTIDKCCRKAKSSASATIITTTESASSSAAPAASSGDSTRSALTLYPVDFEAIINQVLARSGNAFPLSSPFCQVNLPLVFLTPSAAII
jgi:hypothetical protein